MSKAPRPATWKTRSRTWAGQSWWLGQRRSLSPSFCWASGVPQEGHFVGIFHGRRPLGRSGSTGPRISGITSPALRRITVSPGRTSLRFTSWALWSVAFSTVDPATRVGSMTPYGVTRPVRPTLTRISRRTVLTSSGGYLNAIAQRGARLVEPSRRWRPDVVDLDDDAVDLVLDLVAVLAVVLDELLHVLQRGQHLHPRRRRPAPTPRGRGRTPTGRSGRSPRGRRCRGRPCRARGWR